MIKNAPFTTLRHSGLLLLACLMIMLWLHPYWYLSPYSAVGWLDEIRAQIPWKYASRHAGPDDFVHGFAGGCAAVFGYGDESISLYRTLRQIFSLENANLLMRFLGAFAYFSGLYWLVQNRFTLSPWVSMPIALAALLINHGPYGWTLGGMGWDFAISIWMALACMGRFASLKTNYLIGVITILIGATVSNPVFLFYYTLLTALLLLIYIPNRRYFIAQRWRLWLSLAAIMLVVFLFNWHSLYYTVLGSADFSTRLLGTLARTTPEHADSLSVLLYQLNLMYEKLLYIRDYSYIKVFQFDVLMLVFAVCLLTLRLRKLLLLLTGAVVLPALLQALAQSLELPIVASYQWTILWQMLPVYLGISLAYLLSAPPYWLSRLSPHWQNRYQRIRAPFALLCALLPLYYGYQSSLFLHSLSNAYLNKRNSLAAISQYAPLRTLPHQHYRTVTDSKSLPWATPLYYDMDTFDGMQPAFPARRTYFMAYAVELERKDTYPKSHFLNFFQDDAWHDLDMLAMANVKYVLSSDEVLQPADKLRPVLHIEPIQLDNSYGYFPAITQKLIDHYGPIQLLKPLNAFEVSQPWPRVFIPEAIQQSSHSYQAPEFYDQLRQLNYQEIAIAKEDSRTFAAYQGMTIESFALINKGVSITTNGLAGPIVYNQVYTPYWHAYCDKQPLKITPANGIMMAIEAPTGCPQIHFIHELNR